jgi:hypothetical protein
MVTWGHGTNERPGGSEARWIRERQTSWPVDTLTGGQGRDHGSRGGHVGMVTWGHGERQRPRGDREPDGWRGHIFPGDGNGHLVFRYRPFGHRELAPGSWRVKAERPIPEWLTTVAVTRHLKCDIAEAYLGLQFPLEQNKSQLQRIKVISVDCHGRDRKAD